MENTQTEKDLIICLETSTNFMKKIVSTGKLDHELDVVLKSFVWGQVQDNELTLKAYKKE